ncbi:MAG: ABC transporter permease [Anaerolineae bacterium]|nr:ABC transporter permease [Anaerolineae bacterium]
MQTSPTGNLNLTVQRRSNWERLLRRLIGQYGLLIILLLVTLAFALARPAFWSLNNQINIVFASSLIGIMAVCSTMVVLTGGIDLSVSSVVAISGLTAALVLESDSTLLVPSIVAGLAVSGVVGLINGTVIAYLGLPPIVVTLAALTIVRGAALLIGGSILHLIREPAEFLFIGGGRLLGLPFPIFIFAAIAVIMLFVQMRTRFGLTVFAIGENERAAILCGLPVRRVKLLVYLISSLGAGIAGIVLASQVSTASANYGNALELDVIAAIVVGGTSLSGGRGSVHRSVLGALLIAAVNNGLSILNVSTDQQLIAKGLIIIVAISLGNWLQKWSER